MRSIVTGGAGFIGSHLVAKLVEAGHEVVVLDNLRRGNKLEKPILQAVQFVEGDVRNEETVMRCSQKCDIVFHLAAVLGVDIVADNPVETMETEALGMRNVVKAACINGVQKIIYASTSGVYGKMAVEKAVSEEISVSPSSSYSIAKRFNEMYLAAVYQEKNIAAASLRFFNVYGPRQDTRMVIPRFFEQAKAGKPITVFGKGLQTRDFTYVGDVVEAVVRVSKCISKYETINVSNEKEFTIKELAEAIVKITKSKSQIVFMDMPRDRYDFEVERRFGSSEKLFSLVGFKPSTQLFDGLSQINEYLANKMKQENI
jgi:UDP-glucose 4-epimerase